MVTFRAPTPRVESTRPAVGNLAVFSLALASMIGILNGMAIVPFLSLIAHDLGTTVPLLGQIAAGAGFVAALLGLLIGPLADQYGHRRLMVIGIVAIVLGALGTALATSYTALLVIRLASSISGAILGGVSLAIAGGRFTGDAQRRAMSWTTAGIAGAPIAGLPLLALVGGQLGWRYAFVALSAIAVVVGILLLRTLPADDSVAGGRFQPRSVVTAYRPLLADRGMLALYAASTLRSICWVGTIIYLGGYFADIHGLTPEQIGLTSLVFGSGYLAGSLAAGGRFGQVPLPVLFFGSTVAMSLLLATMFLLPMHVTLATLLLGLAAVGSGLGWVALTTLLVRETPAGRGTTMVLNGAMFSLGAAGGGMIGGALIAVGEYGAFGIGMPLFAVAGAALVWRLDLGVSMNLPATPVEVDHQS